MTVDTTCVKKDVYNFSPGPAAMPRAVMEQAQAEFLDFQGSGVSIAEVSHRGPLFEQINAELHANMRAVLEIPDDYELIFSAGGAQCQFSLVPLNLLENYDSAAYLVSGHWSKKAFEEAHQHTTPVRVADAKDCDYLRVPDRSQWNVPKKSAYLYCCDNETVHGLMLPEPPAVDLPVVCDMTSSLITRPVDWHRYGAVVASCQKNIAPAGMTVVVVHRDLLKRKAHKSTPRVLNYQELAKSNSVANTPTTFSWYIANLVAKWVVDQGGVAEMHRRSLQKSALLYNAIDQSDFYSNPIDAAYRSDINVVFKLADESLQDAFLAGAEKEGLLSLKGHRAVGGMRANLYNSMPLAGVEHLVAFMKHFESGL